MNDYINILVNSNNSIVYTTDVPLIYQGSTGSVYLNIEFEKEIPNNAVVELLFRRSDGEMTPWLLTKPIGGTYQFKMEASWFTEKAGSLTYTIKVTRVISDTEEEQLLTSYDVLSILPTQNALFVPAPTKPSNYDIITNRLNSAENDIKELQDENFVNEISTGETVEIKDVNGVRKANTSIKYKTFDGSVNNVIINLPDGLATELEVDRKINNKFTEVEPVTNIIESNNDLEFIVKGYNEPDKTIKIKADSLVTEEEYTNRTATLTDDLVAYEKLADGITPSIQVSFADEAEIANKDALGRVINETYIPLSGGSILNSIDVNSHLKFINNLEIGKGINILPFGDYGDVNVVPIVNLGNVSPFGILHVSANKDNKIGCIDLNPVYGEIQYYNGDTEFETKTVKLGTIASTDSINIFSQPQAFTEQIDIINGDGIRDSIKHLNSNFLISSSDGTNLMDIDSELQTVSFFNKDVSFKDELNDVLNKVVYIECSIDDNTQRFAPNTQPLVITFNNSDAYAVKLLVTSTSVSVGEVLPITGSSTYTPSITNIRTIKVGDL